MSMLAEPRRKQKWNLDPRGKRWSEDTNKFGQKMLEKMGWTSGKGLGINEQGITKHVMLDDKHDKAGIGYDKNGSNGWTEQQEKFNQFLQELPRYKNQEIDHKWEKSEEDQSQQSLELRSKGSFARMHYKRFTRGKDISKYSSKNVMEIFGKKESTNRNQIEKEQDDCIHEKEAIGTRDNRGGVITINSGSMADYFKNKLPNHKKNLSSNMIDNQMAQSDSETEQRVSFRLSLEVKNTLPSVYEISRESSKIDYAFDNPCLKLNSPTETLPKIDSYSSKKRKKEENATIHTNEMGKLNVRKKLKTETINDICKDGFTNLALNLDTKSNENCNGKEFEVSRAQFGLENCGFDLMDEGNDKKRVTFNDHVEYSMDSIKKKKEKITLDKYEIENKHKKKRKCESSTTLMSNGFVNKALDIEMLCEEINDNKLNEHKSKKTKKKRICKTSNLETIQESPEQEKEVNDIKIVSGEITLDSDHAENEEANTTKRKLKKKKKKKKEVNIEDIVTIDIMNEDTNADIEEPNEDKKIKTDKSKTEEPVISKKHKKKKKKDKRDYETDLVRDTIIAINKDQQDVEILEKSKSKKRTDHLVEDNDTFIKDSGIKILPIVITEKEREKSLEHVPKKRKRSHKKDDSKNDINVCEEKEISDKENADEMQDSNVEKLPKKEKKCKNSKKDDILSIGDTLNPSAEVADANIDKENIESIDTPSEANKVVDTIEGIIRSPWSEKARISKKMLKTFFYKNLADFPGSNVHEIKGYGVDNDNS